MNRKEEDIKITHKICLKCGENKPLRDFYRSMSPMYSSDKLLPFCKSCLIEAVEDGTNLEKDAKMMLRQIDRPFLIDIWKSSLEEARRADKSEFGTYMKNLAMPQYINLTWDDSDYRATVRRGQEGKKEREADMIKRENLSEEELDELEEIWGYGFDPQELIYFERKYDSLIGNYPMNTSLHREALRGYCVYKVKAELETARGNLKDAKEWATLAQKQGEIAKININKLDKSDLSQGLDSFSELVRMVEKEVDIIPILPKFIERPQDKVDLAIHSFVNYERRLHGLPDVDHSDIYDFYQESLREYMDDDTKSEDIKRHMVEIEIDSKSSKTGKKKIIFYDVYALIEERKKEKPDDSFVQNLDKWVEFVSWSRFSPDLFFDMITPEAGGITLDVDQRFVLRCLARFKSIYIVFPRGWSKTYINLLYNFHTTIFYPDIEIAMTAQTKENASALIDSKWREITRHFPLIADELAKPPRISKDSAEVEFKSGGILDSLVNGQSSKGQRRRRIAVEEFAQVNNEVFVDCLEPIPNIPRITLGKRGTINPYELNGQIIYLTTSWFVGTDSYEKNLDMVKSMVELKGQLVLGSDWELASNLGRGESRNTILQKKEEISPTFFALNYESRWVENFQPHVVVILQCKFGELTNVRCAYKLKK